MNTNILIVHADDDFSSYLKKLLLDNGYTANIIPNAVKALKKIETSQPDLILSDFCLAYLRGDEFYDQAKKLYPEIPFIFISSYTDQEIISSLLVNRNIDYIIQPFVAAELLARIKAALARGKNIENTEETVKVSNVELDLKTYRAKIGGKHVLLSPTEFKLLEYLMQNKERVLSRDMILQRVWGYSSDVNSRVVDVYIGYLRDKFDNKNKPSVIETVHGFGYRIRE